jgi:hypothetical protein
MDEMATQMATKDLENEARFRKFEAMILHSTSSGFVPDVVQPRTPPDKGNTIFVLFLFFFC